MRGERSVQVLAREQKCSGVKWKEPGSVVLHEEGRERKREERRTEMWEGDQEKRGVRGVKSEERKTEMWEGDQEKRGVRGVKSEGQENKEQSWYSLSLYLTLFLFLKVKFFQAIRGRCSQRSPCESGRCRFPSSQGSLPVLSLTTSCFFIAISLPKPDSLSSPVLGLSVFHLLSLGRFPPLFPSSGLPEFQPHFLSSVQIFCHQVLSLSSKPIFCHEILHPFSIPLQWQFSVIMFFIFSLSSPIPMCCHQILHSSSSLSPRPILCHQIFSVERCLSVSLSLPSVQIFYQVVLSLSLSLTSLLSSNLHSPLSLSLSSQFSASSSSLTRSTFNLNFLSLTSSLYLFLCLTVPLQKQFSVIKFLSLPLFSVIKCLSPSLVPIFSH